MADPPAIWSFSAPDTWGVPGIGPASFLEEEICFVELPQYDEQHFFLRALIEIPVHGRDAPLTYAVWVSVTAAAFARAVEQWDDPVRVAEPPFFGRLANRIPGYPDTLSLRVRVHQRRPGLRPLADVRGADHPLAGEQRDGVPPRRLAEVAEVCGTA